MECDMSKPPIDVGSVMKKYADYAKKMVGPVAYTIADDTEKIRDELFQSDWSRTNLYEYSGRIDAQINAVQFFNIPGSESLREAKDMILTLGYVREKFPIMYSTWFSSFDPTLHEQRDRVFYESFKPYVNSSLLKAIEEIRPKGSK